MKKRIISLCLLVLLVSVTGCQAPTPVSTQLSYASNETDSAFEVTRISSTTVTRIIDHQLGIGGYSLWAEGGIYCLPYDGEQ